MNKETNDSNWKTLLIERIVNLINLFAPEASRELKINFFHSLMLLILYATAAYLLIPHLHIEGLPLWFTGSLQLVAIIYFIAHWISELYQCTQKIFKKDVRMGAAD